MPGMIPDLSRVDSGFSRVDSALPLVDSPLQRPNPELDNSTGTVTGTKRGNTEKDILESNASFSHHTIRITPKKPNVDEITAANLPQVPEKQSGTQSDDAKSIATQATAVTANSPAVKSADKVSAAKPALTAETRLLKGLEEVGSALKSQLEEKETALKQLETTQKNSPPPNAPSDDLRTWAIQQNEKWKRVQSAYEAKGIRVFGKLWTGSIFRRLARNAKTLDLEEKDIQEWEDWHKEAKKTNPDVRHRQWFETKMISLNHINKDAVDKIFSKIVLPENEDIERQAAQKAAEFHQVSNPATAYQQERQAIKDAQKSYEEAVEARNAAKAKLEDAQNQLANIQNAKNKAVRAHKKAEDAIRNVTELEAQFEKAQAQKSQLEKDIEELKKKVGPAPTLNDAEQVLRDLNSTLKNEVPETLWNLGGLSEIFDFSGEDKKSESSFSNIRNMRDGYDKKSLWDQFLVLFASKDVKELIRGKLEEHERLLKLAKESIPKKGELSRKEIEFSELKKNAENLEGDLKKAKDHLQGIENVQVLKRKVEEAESQEAEYKKREEELAKDNKDPKSAFEKAEANFQAKQKDVESAKISLANKISRDKRAPIENEPNVKLQTAIYEQIALTDSIQTDLGIQKPEKARAIAQELRNYKRKKEASDKRSKDIVELENAVRELPNKIKTNQEEQKKQRKIIKDLKSVQSISTDIQKINLTDVTTLTGCNNERQNLGVLSDRLAQLEDMKRYQDVRRRLENLTFSTTQIVKDQKAYLERELEDIKLTPVGQEMFKLQEQIQAKHKEIDQAHGDIQAAEALTKMESELAQLVPGTAEFERQISKYYLGEVPTEELAKRADTLQAPKVLHAGPPPVYESNSGALFFYGKKSSVAKGALDAKVKTLQAEHNDRVKFREVMKSYIIEQLPEELFNAAPLSLAEQKIIQNNFINIGKIIQANYTDKNEASTKKQLESPIGNIQKVLKDRAHIESVNDSASAAAQMFGEAQKSYEASENAASEIEQKFQDLIANPLNESMLASAESAMVDRQSVLGQSNKTLLENKQARIKTAIELVKRIVADNSPNSEELSAVDPETLALAGKMLAHVQPENVNWDFDKLADILQLRQPQEGEVGNFTKPQYARMIGSSASLDAEITKTMFQFSDNSFDYYISRPQAMFLRSYAAEREEVLRHLERVDSTVRVSIDQRLIPMFENVVEQIKSLEIFPEFDLETERSAREKISEQAVKEVEESFGQVMSNPFNPEILAHAEKVLAARNRQLSSEKKGELSQKARQIGKAIDMTESIKGGQGLTSMQLLEIDETTAEALGRMWAHIPTAHSAEDVLKTLGKQSGLTGNWATTNMANVRYTQMDAIDEHRYNLNRIEATLLKAFSQERLKKLGKASATQREEVEADLAQLEDLTKFRESQAVDASKVASASSRSKVEPPRMSTWELKNKIYAMRQNLDMKELLRLNADPYLDQESANLVHSYIGAKVVARGWFGQDGNLGRLDLESAQLAGMIIGNVSKTEISEAEFLKRFGKNRPEDLSLEEATMISGYYEQLFANVMLSSPQSLETRDAPLRVLRDQWREIVNQKEGAEQPEDKDEKSAAVAGDSKRVVKRKIVKKKSSVQKTGDFLGGVARKIQG